jgi:rubrerythrin
MSRATEDILRRYALSRRHFLRAAAVAGSLTVAHAPAHAAGLVLSTAAAQAGGDVGVLNFALALEHLESRLYQQIVGAGVLGGEALRIAQEFGEQEAEHVDALTDTIDALGGDPVREDEYNFPELSSEEEVLGLLVDVEELGVAAYLGAATLVRDPDILTTAIRIHNVEAYHATGVRLLSGQKALEQALGEPKSRDEVLRAVLPFSLGGAPNTGAGGASAARRAR